jgi:Dimerisation domain of Zinc Transporter
MPDPNLVSQISTVALTVHGVSGVETLFARNTGLQYHVDLHLEVDPEMRVRQAHDIANQVRFTIRRKLNWVADVASARRAHPGSGSASRWTLTVTTQAVTVHKPRSLLGIFGSLLATEHRFPGANKRSSRRSGCFSQTS